MIETAAIASIADLRTVSALGTADMALTHLALTRPDYADYFAGRAHAGGRVFLDNSAFELADHGGRGLPAADVMTAAQLTAATDVICQDVPFSADATLRATRQFLREAAAAEYQPARFMAVPHGTTRAEWLHSYDALAALPGVALIGLSKLSVPRCWNAPVAEARLACAAELHHRDRPRLPLHLLGGDRSLPWELGEHQRRGHTAVASHDSSFAFWYAACDLAVDPRTGRAAAAAPSPPDLHRPALDVARRLAAHSNVEILLSHAAGNDSHLAASTVPRT